MDLTRLFDLNIEKILEDWDSAHAVRELIANALDEQVLSSTREVDIYKEPQGPWVIRDFGRGLRYEHFTQNENPEKLALSRSVWLTLMRRSAEPHASMGSLADV